MLRRVACLLVDKQIVGLAIECRADAIDRIKSRVVVWARRKGLDGCAGKSGPLGEDLVGEALPGAVPVAF